MLRVIINLSLRISLYQIEVIVYMLINRHLLLSQTFIILGLCSSPVNKILDIIVKELRIRIAKVKNINSKRDQKYTVI